MANYILHNMGYGNPINFREIVLSTLKGFGICCHLRDYSLSQLGTTDVTKWLANDNYERGNLKHWQESTEEKKKLLALILDGEESIIKSEYQKEEESVTYYKSCETSFYDDEISKARNSVEQYTKYLNFLIIWLNNFF